MIYITGDCHGNFEKIKTSGLSKQDTLIVCGDMGICWQELYDPQIKELEKLGFDILFIDGNHENFDNINSFPEIFFKGGKAHKIGNNIYHLMRGEVFSIENKSFLALGGAFSIDRIFRVKGKSWWEEEDITEKDLMNFKNKKGSEQYLKVDYVITHTCPYSVLKQYKKLLCDIKLNEALIDHTNEKKLEKVFLNTQFQHWYFGHYHHDCLLDPFFSVIYNKIEKID